MYARPCNVGWDWLILPTYFKVSEKGSLVFYQFMTYIIGKRRSNIFQKKNVALSHAREVGSPGKPSPQHDEHDMPTL